MTAGVGPEGVALGGTYYILSPFSAAAGATGVVDGWAGSRG
jgi:hypothetical protein